MTNEEFDKKYGQEYDKAFGVTSALARQVGGDHYKGMKIQPLEYAILNNLGPGEHLVLKYVSRWNKLPKDKGIESLRKAIHVLEIMIELEVDNDA